MTPRIYCFVNYKCSDRKLIVALAEDGVILATQICSNLFEYHIGISSDNHHDAYDAHYSQGYILEWVDNPRTHKKCTNALKVINC